MRSGFSGNWFGDYWGLFWGLLAWICAGLRETVRGKSQILLDFMELRETAQTGLVYLRL